jgi:hypothetical protein
MGCSRDENHWDWERQAKQGKNMQEKSIWGRDGILYVSSLDKLPKDAHFAVIQNESITVPGYDRGDPSTSETIISYIAFENEEALRAWIIKEDATMYSRKEYRVIRVDPVVIKKTVAIELGK